MITRLSAYARLMRLDKPIGMLLVLWPTLWALFLASGGMPQTKLLIIFILGVCIMRSAGCVVNDLADRKFDGFVERTKSRPIVTGEVSIRGGLIIAGILLSMAFGLVLFLNPLTIYLSFVGVFLAVCYPFLKRVTHLPQLGLGAAFSWGVPMAFAAVTNKVSVCAWWLFLIAAIWPVIYDTQYAMSDKIDDLKIGVKSTAILFGQFDKAMIGLLQLLFIVSLIFVGQMFRLSYPFYLCLLFVAALFIYQQWLIKSRSRHACFLAFLNNNWVGCVIFIGIYLGLK